MILSLGLQEKSWPWGEGEGWGNNQDWGEFTVKSNTPKVGGMNRKGGMSDFDQMQMDMHDPHDNQESSQFKDYEYEIGMYDGMEGGFDETGMDDAGGDLDADMDMEMDMGGDDAGGGFDDAGGGGYDDD